MKTQKGPRGNDADEPHKAKRLEPLRKSGKERHALYTRLDEEQDDEPVATHRESAFDYLDDEEQ